MGREAPRCIQDNCANLTWDESGLCHVHQGRASTRFGDPFSDPSIFAPNISNGPTGFVDRGELAKDLEDVFPDLQEIDTVSINDQSENTIRSAVSIEVYRRFPECDHPDPEERNRLLLNSKWEMVEMNEVTPVTFDNDDAALISSSSEDMYGRSMEDSMALASYGLRREWELSRSMGLEEDQNGIRYGRSFSEYCDSYNQHVKKIIDDEFDRQMIHYPRIVKEATGRSPASQVPLIEGQNMDPNVVEEPSIPSDLRVPPPKPIRRTRRPRYTEHEHAVARSSGTALKERGDNPDPSEVDQDSAVDDRTTLQVMGSLAKGFWDLGSALKEEYRERDARVQESRRARRDEETAWEMNEYFRRANGGRRRGFFG